jgi:hypothetical protein
MILLEENKGKDDPSIFTSTTLKTSKLPFMRGVST